MSKTEDAIPQVVLSDQVKEAMEGDPELAEALRSMSADFRQAMQAVKDGRYKTFEDAMEALTGNRPEPVEFEDDDE